MTPRKRQDVLVCVLAVLLVGAALWAYGRCRSQRATAIAARDDLAECKALARQIDQLRHRPDQAGAKELHLDVLNRRIESAARAARIVPEAIDAIWPKGCARVGDTVYLENSTLIVLKRVTMKQLVTALHELTASTPGLAVKSLRLNTPRGQETSDCWDADAVVGYLFYSPPDTSLKNRGS